MLQCVDLHNQCNIIYAFQPVYVYGVGILGILVNYCTCDFTAKGLLKTSHIPILSRLYG